MQLTAEDRTLIRNFNRNVEYLKARDMKAVPAESWVPYEEVVKIIPRSKEWYKDKRNGRINKFKMWEPAVLIRGEDWRMVGKRVEYKLSSIHALHKKMILS